MKKFHSAMPMASIAIASALTPHLVGGFSSSQHSYQRIRTNSVVVAHRAHSNHEEDECCPVCADANCVDLDAACNKLLRSRPTNISPIIHTSRRKFVQLAAASSAFAVSTPARGTDYISKTSASVSVTNNNIIAVPTGPLAPFSSTRQYRTIVLSNGK